MRTPYSLVFGSALAAVLVVAACSTQRQTVPVTERPDPAADTALAEAPQDTTAVVPLASRYDTVKARRFDRGKIWPIYDLPAAYLEETYDLNIDEQWRQQVTRATLRFGGGCTASFVSPNGLVMTNHHCAREYVSEMSQEGEGLLKTGFYARSQKQEQKVGPLYVDRLVEVENVTGRVRKGLPESGDTRGDERRQRASQIEEAMTAEAKQEDDRLRVDVVALHHGAEYVAHTYRRYEDVRLVMLPEQDLGFFGGATDNFTYPRHTLDIAFFRVYDEEGAPLQVNHYFEWDERGATEGESVFVAGNPGSTNRLDMVSQLRYRRDYEMPNRLEVLQARDDSLDDYIATYPDSAAAYGLQNLRFSLQNSITSLEGQLRGLNDPYLLARRAKAVRTLRDSVQAIDSLQTVGAAVGEIQRLQQSKRVLAEKSGAFETFASLRLGSRILTRAIHAYYYDFLRKRTADPERVQNIREDALQIEDWPARLERSFLKLQLREVREAYGADHPALQRLFKDRSLPALADHLVKTSALMDSTAFVSLLEEGYLKSDDASVPVINALAPLYLNVSRQMNDLRSSEETMNRRLSRARIAVYGPLVPPDASFTLRVSDGVVKGYPGDTTAVPAFTTFEGLYEKHTANVGSEWDLPSKWMPPPDTFEVDTPLNLVSTNDISGGSSGSPLLNEDLEVVGVVFDSNQEALPNEFLYRTRSARAISVDVRGIMEALDVVYDADRLVREVTTGRLQASGSGSSPLPN